MDGEEPTQDDDASDEQPSPPDLQQWMDAVWTHVFGFPARSTDVLVVRQLGDDAFESRVEAITDLLWDHWMGEPDDPSLEQVRQFVVSVGRELVESAGEERTKNA